MELAEAMRTQHACRYYRDDPVPDAVLLRAVELARFAPNGGNRCAVRFVFVRDPALRRQLGEWYLPLWEEVAAAAREGAEAIRGAGGEAKSVRTGLAYGHGLPHRRRVPGPPVPAAAAPAGRVRARLRRPLWQPAQCRRGRAVNQAWSSVSHRPNVSPAASRSAVSSASLIS